jgi:hypothetical protein
MGSALAKFFMIFMTLQGCPCYIMSEKKLTYFNHTIAQFKVGFGGSSILIK